MRLTLAAALAACFAILPARAEVTLAVSCGAVGIEAALCREGAEAWARETGNRVEMVSTPAGSTERLALYQQLLAARSGDIDVLQLDVVWPGILGAHLLDLAPHVDRATLDAHFPAVVANNTVDGRLVAMPWFTNAGVLYYRRDLLEKHGRQVPATWEALADTAQAIMQAERAAGDSRLWGFVFQGRAYEGLTVNALEWIASHDGGTIVEADGRITVNNPRAAAALTDAAAWIGTIAPPGVLNYAEEEARAVFQSGNAVFMRNWPYAWALAQVADSPIRGKVGTVPLPRSALSGEGGACLGGWQLGVSTYSRNQDAAVQLVRFLTGKEEQRRRAIVGAFSPTIPALYQDQEVMRTQPAALGASLAQATARPSTVTGARYNEVSIAFHTAVHNVLTGQSSAAEALRALEAQLRRILR
jgi:trehalose/maltose transport system substrate-binding protein